jgi:PDZ domain-containing protein
MATSPPEAGGYAAGVSSSAPGDPTAGPSAPAGRNPIGALVTGISRRVRTLIVAGGLFLVLLILAMTLPVPYVVLSPGPTYNTLSTTEVDNKEQAIIAIDGRTPNKTSGNLNLTTVSYSTSKLTVFDALSAWLQDDEVVVPRSSLFPPGQSTADVDKQNTADFTESQDDAIAAAGCELGYPPKFGVLTVLSNGAAAKQLRPGDLITSVDGRPTTSQDALLAELGKLSPGTTVTVAITRAGKPMNVRVTLGKPLQGRSGASLGIGPGEICQMPFTVDLGLGNQIGGPSAGMMFALGIIDKVGKNDLTGGRFIAGTGTIDAAGKVGAIGGIQLKMIAARNAGATVFLAPAGNCDDVKGAIPSGLDVIKVSTLHQAVQDLEAIEKGQSVAHC